MQTKSRKFWPQPIEESTRSSPLAKVEHVDESAWKEELGQGRENNSPQHASLNDPTLPGVANSGPAPTTTRRFVPEPIETTSRSSRRRFAIEPIETSTRRSKDKGTQETSGAAPPRRRFVPEPVETSIRSSKDKKQADLEHSPSARTRRKFVSEPIETTTTSRRRLKPADEKENDEGGGESETSQPESVSPASSAISSRTSSGPRRFSPELLETAKGSYRRAQSSPPSTTLKQPELPGSLLDLPPEGGDEGAGDEIEESRFSAAALARRNPELSRQHSFVVPDLPVIESNSDDEGSGAASLADPPSSDGIEHRQPKRPAARDSYTEYVLRLAAETVDEKELQEQAMAAYINERPHEPVDHFAISHDPDEDGPLPVPTFSVEDGADVKTFRRSSAAELDLELQSMRRHHEQLERAKRELRADTAGQSRFSAAALATRHHLEEIKLKKAKKLRAAISDEDSELARMRAAAAPPMLGGDLQFPFTISPKMTRCDTDQVPRPRTAEADDDEMQIDCDVQLWQANVKKSSPPGAGLWMGMCQMGHQEQVQPQSGQRSGIVTPTSHTPGLERNNPFEPGTPGRDAHTPGRRRPISGTNFLPLTPPRSSDGEDTFTSTIDKKLQLEKQIEEEFPNRVITQIYNYLSLGYPSLAHMFDEELSKISKISLEELRRDDYNIDAKGYVGVPEGDGVDESEVVNGKCKRWEALRLYVREWARQSPNFVEQGRGAVIYADDDWGARVRRGSWAV